ncbi:frataxin, mitochondrial-like, partial [Telopea speciosissima]|uniref:frataxin, mitochondrial-like n=1 Tax=Telopea speciosissima TaxID=54955 RepID=UPI001CC6E97F
SVNLDDAQGPAAIDYRSLFEEDKFHCLADATIHDLQEKLEEYSDDIQIDGFDIDYANQVLTFNLGNLGTYVLNKQTPNRQIWLSSPVSGPSRFDWDISRQSWIYRRTKANLLQLLENELEQLCGKPISLS